MEHFFSELFSLILTFIEVVLHLDVHLAVLTQNFGYWTYAILFLIIFSETGLVVFPFLPGDSLLFAVGAVAALEGSALRIELIIPLLILAGIIGNTVNYYVGYFVGPKVFSSESSIFLNRNHLHNAQAFYEKHGALTIVITRFIPIIRTFAPFVAGIGRMSYSKFISYNIAGAVIWVGSITIAGYLFGNLPVIQKNFHFVIFAILIISVLPMVITWWKSRRQTMV